MQKLQPRVEEDATTTATLFGFPSQDFRFLRHFRTAQLLHLTGGMSPPYDLKERTMEFAVAVYRLCRDLPGTDESRHVADQLRRAASSVAANYRAACRGRSDRELLSKLGTCVEEGDESGFWLDFIGRIELLPAQAIKRLSGEANELVAIFAAGRKTTRRKMEAKKRKTGEASRT